MNDAYAEENYNHTTVRYKVFSNLLVSYIIALYSLVLLSETEMNP